MSQTPSEEARPSVQNRYAVLPLAIAFTLIAALSLGLAGCQGSKTSTTPPAESSTAQETTPAEQPEAAATNENGETLYTPAYKPNGKEVAVIKTNKGTITVALLGNDAPVTVGSFVELVNKGFYSGLKFHRFEPGFVIQGGDPQTKDLTAEQVKANSTGAIGSGGPGYAIVGEFNTNPNKHVDGTLAMARSQSPDSGGSQFYFTLGPQSFLDNNYTVFGQTTKGLDVIHQLAVGDVIESVTIENATK
jgi:peptidyl-prolyl cis-trans isomerase B (cyclophilin B)